MKVGRTNSWSVLSHAAHLKAILEEVDLVASKAVLRTFVKRIEINGNKATIRYTLPMPPHVLLLLFRLRDSALSQASPLVTVVELYSVRLLFPGVLLSSAPDRPGIADLPAGQL